MSNLNTDIIDVTKDVLTVEEACKLLNICSSTARKYIRLGIIPSRRVGRRILIGRRALLDWVNKDRGTEKQDGVE